MRRFLGQGRILFYLGQNGYVREFRLPSPVALLDRGGATLALGRKATARTAALINATAAHTMEVDDIYRDAIYHPGAPTIAAALAVAEESGANGEAFLRGVIVGYEISTRIGATMGRAHYRYWHNTGTIGSFGAAEAGLLAALVARLWTLERAPRV